MQQHTKGVMGILLLVLLEIYCSLQQWKNFANLARIDKVTAKINRVSAFLDHPVIVNNKNERWYRLIWPTMYSYATYLLYAYDNLFNRVFIKAYYRPHTPHEILN